MADWFRRIRKPSLQYLAISFSALVLDVALGFLLFRLGFSAVFSATSGYIFGLLAAYPLLHLYVFRSKFSSRLAEFLLFMSSGVLGTFVTWGAALLGSGLLDLSFQGSKIIAVAASFVSVFLFRYYVVFAKYAP